MQLLPAEIFETSLPKVPAVSVKMIANFLPNEATHSSLDLLEKQPLFITSQNAFDQKI